jgi:hypothetical protein
MYLLERSHHISTLRIIENKISMPPMVGVPVLLKWVDGPSSLTCCVRLKLLSLPIIHGARIKLTESAVTLARAVLKVM